MEFLLDETIWSAADAGNLSLLKVLIKTGLNINSQDEIGYSPLHAAVTYGHIKIVEYLLNEGANPNIQDIDGDTPLHTCEIPNIADLLISKGANPNIKNYSGKSVREQAIELENEEMITYWETKNIQ